MTVTIDWPLHSRHPRHGFVYELNYGFIAGVPGRDGEDLDAYVLGIGEPFAAFTGRCIAVLRRLNDTDDKLIVVPDGLTFTDEQIVALTHFQEQWFTSVLLRPPPAPAPVPAPVPLLARMKRVDGTLAARYRQKGGQ